MPSYIQRHLGSTPQTERSDPSQVLNDAGGYVYEADAITKLRRFLILGTEGGTYYAGESKLTKEAISLVRACWLNDPKKTVETIVSVSMGGFAPKADPAIFALAVGASAPSQEARKRALDAVPAVCRTGTHLFMFVEFVTRDRGWGKGLRKAVGRWYTEREVGATAYQIVKYRQRHGWTHRDLLRSAHPKALNRDQAALFDYVCGRGVYADGSVETPRIIEGYEVANSVATNAREVAETVVEYRLPREAVPTEYLPDPLVQEALLQHMPIGALIRNLGNMTRSGLLAPGSDATRLAVSKLIDPDVIRYGRVHPFNVLVALVTYASGQGARGSGSWTPVTEIVDALDVAFYSAFGNVEPLGCRTLLALDTSGSMQSEYMGGVPGMSPARAQAAMALILLATNPPGEVEVIGFDTDVTPISLSPRQRLDDVYRITALGRGRGTNAALPILWAQSKAKEFGAIVTYTDGQTWQGDVHVDKALADYRRGFGPCRLAQMAMGYNGYALAPLTDPLSLQVVGLDTSAPVLISEFIKGNI